MYIEVTREMFHDQFHSLGIDKLSPAALDALFDYIQRQDETWSSIDPAVDSTTILDALSLARKWSERTGTPSGCPFNTVQFDGGYLVEDNAGYDPESPGTRETASTRSIELPNGDTLTPFRTHTDGPVNIRVTRKDGRRCEVFSYNSSNATHKRIAGFTGGVSSDIPQETRVRVLKLLYPAETLAYLRRYGYIAE